MVNGFNGIKVARDAEGISASIVGFVGNFEAYRSVCSAAGGIYRAQPFKRNVVPLRNAAKLLSGLISAGLSVHVDPDAAASIQAFAASIDGSTQAAGERAAGIDAELQKRGLALFPYQHEGIKWLAGLKAAILADPMGLGKTVQTLLAIPSGAPVLVVSPAVAKGVWVREIKKWRPDLTRVTVISGRGNFRWPERGEVIIVNYDVLPLTADEAKGAVVAAAQKKDVDIKAAALAKAPEPLTTGEVAGIEAKWAEKISKIEKSVASEAPEGVVMVCDEAHVLKGGAKTQRGARCRSMTASVRKRDGWTWGLTATPLLNRPPEIWSVFTAFGIERDAFGSWPKFVEMFRGFKNNWGGYEWGVVPVAEVAARLRPVMLRRRREEVLTQLPSKTRQVIDVEIDASTRKLCDSVLKILEARGIDLKSAESVAKASGINFEELSAARAALAKAKIPAMLEMVEEFEDAEEPLVVFSAHRAPIDAFQEREGWAVITGDTAPDKRSRIEDDFQAGKLRGVACTIQAGGVAITLTKAAFALFVDQLWTPELNDQAEDRIYRIGQLRPVMIKILAAAHPIDQRVSEVINDKRALVGASVGAAAVTSAAVSDKSAEVMAALRLVAEQAAQATKEAVARREAAERNQSRSDAGGRPGGAPGPRRGRSGTPEEIEALELLRGCEESTMKSLVSQYDNNGGLSDAQWRYVLVLAPRARKMKETTAKAEARRLAVRRPADGPREAWAERALRTLVACDGDYAEQENGVGFNKGDSYAGHRLVGDLDTFGGLTEEEWAMSLKILAKYHGQVGRAPTPTPEDDCRFITSLREPEEEIPPPRDEDGPWGAS